VLNKKERKKQLTKDQLNFRWRQVCPLRKQKQKKNTKIFFFLFRFSSLNWRAEDRKLFLIASSAAIDRLKDIESKKAVAKVPPAFSLLWKGSHF